jgi:hypothetical protein
MSKNDIKKLYIKIKGAKEYKDLTEQQKMFLKELQFQSEVMTDFCHELTKSEIIILINNCKSDIQLENSLRTLKFSC